MAKIVTTLYQCDVCRKAFDKETDVSKHSVPCYGGNDNFQTTTSVDLCYDCASKLRQVIFDQFAEIHDDFGLQIKKKF